MPLLCASFVSGTQEMQTTPPTYIYYTYIYIYIYNQIDLVSKIHLCIFVHARAPPGCMRSPLDASLRPPTAGPVIFLSTAEAPAGRAELGT